MTTLRPRSDPPDSDLMIMIIAMIASFLVVFITQSNILIKTSEYLARTIQSPASTTPADVRTYDPKYEYGGRLTTNDPTTTPKTRK